ncbi:MAG: hypothetical protein MZV65_34325 [Chromatiales bacterium]|nr:hypothetical protein [Chromatiales bacterium]
MAHLFATTDLERTYRVNLNVIGLRRPAARDRPARTLLDEWLEFRIDDRARGGCSTGSRRSTARLHILDGLLIAYLQPRRGDPHHPPRGRAQAGADAALQAQRDRRPRRSSRPSCATWRKLEEMKIRGEQNGARRRSATSWRRSSSRHGKLKRLVRDEIIADAEKYGDERRSPLVERGEAAQAIDETAAAAERAGHRGRCRTSGWVRAAKGHDIDPARSTYKTGDRFLQRRARQEQPAGGVPRLDRPQLHAAGAQAAVGAWPRRAAGGRVSTRRPARPGRA